MGNDFNLLEYADPELDKTLSDEHKKLLDEDLTIKEKDSEEEREEKENKRERIAAIQSRLVSRA